MVTLLTTFVFYVFLYKKITLRTEGMPAETCWWQLGA